MVDVAFVDYEFPVTGGMTNRTLPDRLSDIANIRDWGAVGDGVTDDWQAIQNAIDRFSVDLTVAVLLPHVPASAVRATCTARVGSGAVAALTIGAEGYNYVPSQVYTIKLSGGGGTGATATATANGSGVINQASLAITAGGTGYSPPRPAPLSIRATSPPSRLTRSPPTSSPATIVRASMSESRERQLLEAILLWSESIPGRTRLRCR